jgi:hypothetical protein
LILQQVCVAIMAVCGVLNVFSRLRFAANAQTVFLLYWLSFSVLIMTSADSRRRTKYIVGGALVGTAVTVVGGPVLLTTLVPPLMKAFGTKVWIVGLAQKLSMVGVGPVISGLGAAGGAKLGNDAHELTSAAKKPRSKL